MSPRNPVGGAGFPTVSVDDRPEWSYVGREVGIRLRRRRSASPTTTRPRPVRAIGSQVLDPVLARPTLSLPDPLAPDRPPAADSSAGSSVEQLSTVVEVVDVVGSLVVVVAPLATVVDVDSVVGVDVVEVDAVDVDVVDVDVVEGHGALVVVVLFADVEVVVLAAVADVEVVVVWAIAPVAVSAMARITMNAAKARNQPIPGSARRLGGERTPVRMRSSPGCLLAGTR